MSDLEMKDYIRMADEYEDADEYEEEIVERDEYYDEENPDEFYGEEAYDEEAYDEEYYDEENPEEEYYDEEYQDDGYSEEYYDDRFDRVLQELETLKTNMKSNAPAAMPYPYMMPQFVPYNNQNDSGLYNEIGRLRDELNRTQNQQTVHQEIAKLKEDLRFKDELLATRHSGSTSALLGVAPTDTAHGDGVRGAEFHKLVEIIVEMNKRLAGMDGKISHDIAALQKEVAQIQKSGLNVSAAKIEELINKVKPSKGGDRDVAATISALREDIRDIVSGGSVYDDSGRKLDITDKLDTIESAVMHGLNVDELTRLLYEIKRSVGSLAAGEAEHLSRCIELFNDIEKLQKTAGEGNLAHTLKALHDFDSKLAAIPEGELGSISMRFNSILHETLAMPVDGDNIHAALEFNSSSFNPVKDEAVNNFIIKAAELNVDDIYTVAELANELASFKNTIQDDRMNVENDELLNEIMAHSADVMFGESEESVAAANERLAAAIAELKTLTIGDIVHFPEQHRPHSVKKAAEAGIAAMIKEIRDLILSGTATHNSHSSDHAARPSSGGVSPAIINRLVDEVNNLSTHVSTLLTADLALTEFDELRAAIAGAPLRTSSIEGENANNISNADVGGLAEEVAALKRDLVTISGRSNNIIIDEIRNLADKLGGTPEQTENAEEANGLQNIIYEAGALTEANLAVEIQTIRDALSEIEQNLRNDILTIQESLIVARTEEREEIATNNETVKGDLNALTLEIRQDLFALNDEVRQDIAAIAADETSANIFGEVTALRDELTKMQESNIVNSEIVDNAYSETLLLREDITAIKEDVFGIKDATYGATQDMLGNIFAETAGVKEDITALKEDSTTLILSVKEDSAALRDDITAFKEDVTAFKEDSTTLILSVKEDSAALRDDITAFKEDVTALKEDSTTLILSVKEDSAALRDDIAALKDDIIIVTSDVLSVKDELTALKDTQASAETVNNIYSETIALREELANFKDSQAAGSEIIDNAYAETLALRDDVNIIKELQQADSQQAAIGFDTVTNIYAEAARTSEELAVAREEISALAEQSQTFIEQTQTILDQQQLLSEQISMLSEQQQNLATSETVNNIYTELTGLYDEINALREQQQNLATAEIMSNVYNEVTGLYDEFNSMREQQQLTTEVVNSNDSLMSGISTEISAIREEILQIRAANDDNEILANENKLNLIDEITHVQEEVSRVQEEVSSLRAVLGGLATSDSVLSLTSQTLTLQENFDDVTRVLNERDTAGTDEFLNEISAKIDDAFTRQLSNIEDIRKESERFNSEMTEELEELRAEILQASQNKILESFNSSGDINAEALSFIFDELTKMRTEISELNQTTPATDETISNIATQIEELKSEIAASAAPVATAEVNQETMQLFFDELSALREEISASRTQSESETVTAEVNQDTLQLFFDEMTALRGEIASIQPQPAPVATAEANQETMQLFFDELSALREEISASRAQPEVGTPTAEVNQETLQLFFDEMAALREEIANIQPQTTSENVTAEVNQDTMQLFFDEMAALREEISNIRPQVTADHVTAEVNQDTMQLFFDEMTALREEISNIRPQVTAENITAELNEDTMQRFFQEIATLREEMLNMTAVNAIANDNTELLQEIASLKEEITTLKSGQEMRSDSEVLDEIRTLRAEMYVGRVDGIDWEKEIAHIKADIRNQKSESNEALIDEINKLKMQVEETQSLTVGDTQNAILEEIGRLKDELTVQREADTTAMNFMAEMAHILERQNETKANQSNELILNELSKLKKEVSETKNSSKSDNAILKELNQIKQTLKIQHSAGSNVKVKEDLKRMRNQLATSSPKDAQKILAEIERLREDVTAIIESDESRNDISISDSMNELAEELNAIAGIVSEPAKKTGVRKKKVSSLTSKKVVQEEQQTRRTMEITDVNEMAQHIADKLVLNKLVALGDGDIKAQESEVNDIVSEIIASDYDHADDAEKEQVRNITNELVIERLRERLKK